MLYSRYKSGHVLRACVVGSVCWNAGFTQTRTFRFINVVFHNVVAQSHCFVMYFVANGSTRRLFSQSRSHIETVFINTTTRARRHISVFRSSPHIPWSIMTNTLQPMGQERQTDKRVLSRFACADFHSAYCVYVHGKRTCKG